LRVAPDHAFAVGCQLGFVRGWFWLFVGAGIRLVGLRFGRVGRLGSLASGAVATAGGFVAVDFVLVLDVAFPAKLDATEYTHIHTILSTGALRLGVRSAAFFGAEELTFDSCVQERECPEAKLGRLEQLFACDATKGSVRCGEYVFVPVEVAESLTTSYRIGLSAAFLRGGAFAEAAPCVTFGLAGAGHHGEKELVHRAWVLVGFGFWVLVFAGRRRVGPFGSTPSADSN
jgi:hypothetical protein